MIRSAPSRQREQRSRSMANARLRRCAHPHRITLAKTQGRRDQTGGRFAPCWRGVGTSVPRSFFENPPPRLSQQQSSKTAPHHPYAATPPDCIPARGAPNSTTCCRRRDGHDGRLARFPRRCSSSCYTYDPPRRGSRPSRPPGYPLGCRAHSAYRRGPSPGSPFRPGPSVSRCSG